jgi:hypothetical protein
MPGLVPEADAESASTVGGDHAFSTTSADNTDVQGSARGSHLDSFFESSSWTREDVMLVLAMFQVAVLIAALVGVYDA